MMSEVTAAILSSETMVVGYQAEVTILFLPSVSLFIPFDLTIFSILQSGLNGHALGPEISTSVAKLQCDRRQITVPVEYPFSSLESKEVGPCFPYLIRI